MTPAEILRQAATLIEGQRDTDHGPFLECHQRIASLWGAYLERDLTAREVADMMELLKIARGQTGKGSLDTFIDRAGYAALAGAIWQTTKD